MTTKIAYNTIRLERPKLGKSYEPAAIEGDLYKFWDENDCFSAADNNAQTQQSFCIVIPPPNVTGVLHMGHALSYSIQDILIRWRRMRGDNTLWLPGTDHAGIATQAQVERAIAKEGKGPDGKPLTRHDLGRQAFLERTWKWKDEHGTGITKQLRRLGSSLDWQRERFTMDEGLSQAVREVFVRLYREGLIYRGERIINWCVRCQTALSDLEVIPTERGGHFWHIVYKVADESGGAEAQLVIATTRPETLLGDTAIAVHPDDDRYKHLHGKKVVLPLLGRLIPIITDQYVDREFGSGALKITPAHDFNDYDIGKRHDLPIVSVMGKDGTITAAGGPYSGLKFVEARERVIQDLKAGGLLIKTEEHLHKIGLCQRCESVAEPVVSKQWFVKVAPLAKPAIEAVESGKIVFVPKNWEKTYFEWMYNIRDWCISRQLWWGHQIPAWYCGRCQQITVERSTPAQCEHCGASSSDLKQDEDVLDTWFSSALWPFSTLGWPKQTDALKTFYPTSIMETGFDIIFFWVARMIMMGIHFMKEVPFHKVYLHAMVRDENGEKMSKSKGNVIDPLVVIDKSGADPLRFTLAAMAGQGRDIKLSVERVDGYKAFCNKLWNATKFFHLQLEAEPRAVLPDDFPEIEKWLKEHRAELRPVNGWILSRVEGLCSTVDKGLSDFEINLAAQAIYEFSWYEFCDWYIEFAKVLIREGGNTKQETLYTFRYVLERLLRLAHPFIPFVTEELWQSLPAKTAATTSARKASGRAEIVTLMLQRYPEQVAAFIDVGAERTILSLKNIIEAIRNFRGENRIAGKVRFKVYYIAASKEVAEFIRLFRNDICALAQLEDLVVLESQEKVAGKVAVIQLTDPAIEFRIELDGLVDLGEESSRLSKELEKISADLEFVRTKLAKPSFIEKAPAALVEKEKAREYELVAKKQELDAAIKRLGCAH